jgi:hypothetical protein
MLPGGRQRAERSEIPSLTGAGIRFARIQAVATRFKFSDHLRTSQFTGVAEVAN